MDGGTFQCEEDVPPASMSGIIVSEFCDSFDISVSESFNGGDGCPGNAMIITRVFTVEDGSGNSQSCTVVYTVIDTIASITCPADVTVQCATLVPARNPGAIPTTDNCGGMTTVVFSGDAISNQTCPNRFIVTRTYTATDPCGNTATCNQTITVFDNTPPTITCPMNVTVQCASLVPAPNVVGIVTSDNCGGSATVTFVGDAISNQTCVNRFTVTRTYRATDSCGNSATCNQTITVFDNIVPLITCPQNISVECANLVPPPNTASVTAEDNCGGIPVITHVGDAISNQTCADRFLLTRTYRATDECGNSATCTQLITVFDDTPPVITCPPAITVECANLVPAPTPGTLVASDNCGGVTTVTFINDVVSNQVCADRFTITRRYQATDACGNTATCNQTITVFDDTVPVITCPANVTVQCASLVPAQHTGSVISSDNCGGATTVTFVNDVVSNQTCVNRFIVTRAYRATDACGNSATCAQIITVFDNTAPSITCPVDISIDCDESSSPANTGTATATDNCGCSPVITFSNGPVIGACPQFFIRTWIATDACGNSATCAQTITSDDTTSPVITCPANVTISCSASTLPANTGTATATDDCDLALTITPS